MPKYILLAAFFCSLITSCKTTQNRKNASNLILEYKRTPCFGSCEVFEISIYENGYTEVNKKNFMDVKGTFNTKLKKTELKSIKKQLDDMNFCSLDSIYGMGVSDLPSSIISYQCGTSSKTVIAKMNYPEKLSEFINKMHDITKREDLTPMVYD